MHFDGADVRRRDGQTVRLECLTLRIGGEDLVLPFHDRLTVVGGIGLAERQEMVEMLVGALAGGLGPPASCVTSTSPVCT